MDINDINVIQTGCLIAIVALAIYFIWRRVKNRKTYALEHILGIVVLSFTVAMGIHIMIIGYNEVCEILTTTESISILIGGFATLGFSVEGIKRLIVSQDPDNNA